MREMFKNLPYCEGFISENLTTSGNTKIAQGEVNKNQIRNIYILRIDLSIFHYPSL